MINYGEASFITMCQQMTKQSIGVSTNWKVT